MKNIYIQLVFRLIFSITILVFFSCSEIERDNILDPANPSSMRDNLVVLEAFINTSDEVPDTLSYNFDALAAIDELKNTYKDKIIICEYHWNSSRYQDPFSVTNVDITYETYVNAQGNSEDRKKGVPDLFLNGAFNRVQGASSSSNVINRVKYFTSTLLNKPGEYTIEADVNINNNDLKITYRIARLGNQRSPETRLRILTTYNSGGKGQYTVSSIELPVIIPAISAGEYYEKGVEIDVTGINAENLVFILLNEAGTEVLGALEKKL